MSTSGASFVLIYNAALVLILNAWQHRTTGKRMLILLDNAATPDQVVPLLPGGNTCTVLITSRNRLASLIARHSARPVYLDVLADTEARALLTDALQDSHTSAPSNSDTTADAQRAITELIDLCQGLPLALGLIDPSHRQITQADLGPHYPTHRVDRLANIALGVIAHRNTAPSGPVTDRG